MAYPCSRSILQYTPDHPEKPVLRITKCCVPDAFFHSLPDLYGQLWRTKDLWLRWCDSIHELDTAHLFQHRFPDPGCYRSFVSPDNLKFYNQLTNPIYPKIKKMKKVIFGLCAAVIAVTASAFTVLMPPTATVYGRTPEGKYTRRTNPYRPIFCEPTSNGSCILVVTLNGNNMFPDTPELTSAQVWEYLNNGWLSDTNSGVYTGL